jgi:predicted ATP-grasp superfamily ATP-dependent carboligase
MEKNKILLLDGQHKNTLAILRHLGRTSSYEIHVVSYQKTSISFYSKYAHKKLIITDPLIDGEVYIRDLLQLLKNDNYLALIPVSYISFLLCSSHKESILKYTHLTIAREESVRTASSKIATYRLAQQLEIPYPDFIEVDHIDDIGMIEISYPCVIKAPFEIGKTVVEYVNNKAELIEKYATLCKTYHFRDKLPIIQKYIQGDGAGFFAFYQHGICKSFFVHKRLREYPVTGGASTAAEGFYNSQVIEDGKKILDSLQWEGVAMVEFKKDNSTGLYNIMEINAKFWGSLDLALVSGVNFPQMMIDDALGKEIQVSENYKMVRFQWILNGDLYHVLEKPSHILLFIRDLFMAKNDFYLRDIKPNLFQLMYIPVHYYKKWFK